MKNPRGCRAGSKVPVRKFLLSGHRLCEVFLLLPVKCPAFLLPFALCVSSRTHPTLTSFAVLCNVFDSPLQTVNLWKADTER